MESTYPNFPAYKCDENNGLTKTLALWKIAIRQNQQRGCAPSEDSDQSGHPPSLIRVFAVRMKKPWVLSYPMSPQQRLWSDWADAQADLSLRWAHIHFVGFVMSQLISSCAWLSFVLQRQFSILIRFKYHLNVFLITFFNLIEIN